MLIMRTLKKLIFTAIISLFLHQRAFAQPPITVGTFTACPNQTVTGCATWNNVGSATYTIVQPTGSTPTFTNMGSNNCFALSNAGPGPSVANFTIYGSGIYANAPITASAIIVVSIQSPPVLTITNPGYFCFGSNATFTADIGGANYLVTGPYPNVNSPSKIINFGPLGLGHSGNYTVTSVISGCTVTGVTSVNISPNNQISVNSTSNICQSTSAIVTLSASLPSGGSYQWSDPYGTPLTPGNIVNVGGFPSGITPTNSGVYTATACLNYNGLCCPRTASTQINVVATNPVLTAASPAALLCQGNSLNLSASAGGANTWSWVGPGSFVSSVQNPVINPATPAATGIYSVTAFFVGSFITCSVSSQINVQVVPVNLPIITMPNSVCQSNNIGLNFSVLASGANQFIWTGPGSFSNTVQGAQQTISAPQPSNSGTYYVTAKFGGNLCSSTSSAQLNVVPVNTVSVVPPGIICEPTNANLQANATGANLFTWVGPNNFSSPGANVIVYYPTPAASGVYTVTAYFVDINLTCKNTNTLLLTVYPVMHFTLIPRQQTCYKVPITITGPSGATSYTWTSSTGFISHSKDVFIASVEPKNSGTYTLNVSLGPCISGAETSIEVISPIQFTLTPKSRSICRGDTIVLEGGVSGGTQNYAYGWNPAVYLPSSTGSIQTVVPLGSIAYNLIVHDIACPNFSLTHSFDITVNQPPNPVVQLKAGEGCSPLDFVVNTKTQKEAFVTTFDFGGLMKYQKVFAGTDTVFQHFLNAGTYTLSIYSVGKNGCSGTYVYPYPIKVHEKPGADFYTDPEKPTSTDDISFIATTKYQPITYYGWSFLGGKTPGDTNVYSAAPDTFNLPVAHRSYENAGKYPVLLMTETDFGCRDTVVKYIDVIDDMHLYIPNTFTPNDDGVNDVFFVKGMGVKTEGFSIEISDRWGNVIFYTKDINEVWDGSVKGVKAKDGEYIYRIKAIGLNGEGRKEISGFVTILK